MLAIKIISPFFFMVMRIISIIVYLVTILAAFGGRVNPDYLAFPSLLCLAFPYFVILSILLIVFWLLCRKIFFCGLGILTIVICLTPMSAAFPLRTAKSPEGDGNIFKVMSWNVLHTNDIRNKDYPGNRAVEYMINSGADVIGLAELFDFTSEEINHFTDSLRDSLFKIYPYHAGSTATDIKVLSRYPVESIEKIRLDPSGHCRYEFFKVSFPENELILAMVHLFSYELSKEERMVVTDINSMESAKSSLKEFKGSIFEKLQNAFRHRAEDAKMLREELDDISADVPVIVCGDFNDVPASWSYNIIRGDDLKDAYAETNIGPAVTYNLHAFYFHIDQMLYRGPLKALDLTVGKINSSDHYPLIGEFQFETTASD